MLAHENSKRAYKNTKKNCKSFKLDKSNAVSIGTTAVKPYLSICPVGLVLVRKVVWENVQSPSLFLRWIALGTADKRSTSFLLCKLKEHKLLFMEGQHT